MNVCMLFDMLSNIVVLAEAALLVVVVAAVVIRVNMEIAKATTNAIKVALHTSLNNNVVMNDFQFCNILLEVCFVVEEAAEAIFGSNG